MIYTSLGLVVSEKPYKPQKISNAIYKLVVYLA